MKSMDQPSNDDDQDVDRQGDGVMILIIKVMRILKGNDINHQDVDHQGDG